MMQWVPERIDSVLATVVAIVKRCHLVPNGISRRCMQW